MNYSYPDICTERLTIIPFSFGHITSRYIGWLNDPELMRFSEQRHNNHTHATCKRYLDGIKDTPNMMWALEENAIGLGHIGNLTATMDLNNKLADIGILIGEVDARGCGYGYEAIRAVSDFLFDQTSIRKITAGTVSINTPMLKLMHKLQMVEDGIRRRHYLIDGKEVDIIHMALFKYDKETKR